MKKQPNWKKMGQRHKLLIHRRNNKNGQDLYKLVLNLTLTKELQNQWVYSNTAGGKIGTNDHSRGRFP